MRKDLQMIWEGDRDVPPRDRQRLVTTAYVLPIYSVIPGKALHGNIAHPSSTGYLTVEDFIKFVITGGR